MNRTHPSDVSVGPPDRPEHTVLQVTPYDRVASMLISLLILIGTATMTMLVLWLTSRVFAGQPPSPVQLENISGGDRTLGGGMELDAPDADQLGLETDLEERLLQDTMAVVADVVADNAAILDSSALTDHLETGPGGSTGRRGLWGDGEGPGPGKGRHWEVHFSETSLEVYAAQLDYFKIELGVVTRAGKVEYASRLSQSRPATRSGTTEGENRYYLTLLRGELEEADRQLLDKAGIEHKGGLIVKFLPRDVEEWLAELERDKAGGEADDVRATYFGIKRDGGDYAFYVIDQRYR